ncbi:MAG: glycosyl hydrolase family 18 protein, partial [Anaerolineae bacterium]
MARVGVQDDAPGWCVAVWYPSADMPGGLDSIRANADLIGIVHPFWYAPLADGTLETVDEDADLLAEWRALGMTIIPSIRAGFSQEIVDPAVRAFHIQTIIDLVERMDYDGIDIDYESFPLATRDDFSTFIEALSEVLHARGKLLTIAVHAKTDDAGTWEGAAAQDWMRIAPAVDVFTIMTYDYTSSNRPPGPIAPPDWVRAVLRYAATVTDLGKVRMGLHYYGYSWVRDNPPATNVSWAEVERLIES